MRDLCTLAIDTARKRGASYADVRIVETRKEAIAVRNGALGSSDLGEDQGFGVRVIADGAWGFASSPELTKPEIERAAALAVSLAKASALAKQGDVKLAHEPAYEDFWATPYTIHPFKVPLEEKLALLFKIDEVLRKDPRIKVSLASMDFLKETQHFASTEGSYIVQELIRSGCGYSATAVQNGEQQTRSFPMSFGGQYKTGGYELIVASFLLENAERIREEAIELTTAPELPAMTTDLILGREQMVLQIHESVGHPNELDRVLGWEANYAGRSFNTPEHLRDRFHYGSEIVNLVADNTVPGGLATAGYDDDGVKAQRWHVVQNGIFSGYFMTRDTAPFIGLTRSNGCNRAEGWNNIPITRIPNLSLMPGSAGSLQDLIGSTKSGIFMDTNRSWSIDQMRLNFQFGCEVAREVKDGKLGKLYRNPNYQGITPEFWRGCDAICGHDEWDLVGVSNCGKGQPGQRAEMSHGCSPARFKGVKVGVKA
ncbi:TldD/PmbA family protein [bacterium]|nr:TldD/PmbA family protein [bacterium]